jgi:hypothetical protein
MAQLHARGDLELGADFVHASLIGSRFTGRLIEQTSVGGYPAVVPTVRGRAWVTGLSQYLLDPDDPFPAGFLVRGVSPTPQTAVLPSSASPGRKTPSGPSRPGDPLGSLRSPSGAG